LLLPCHENILLLDGRQLYNIHFDFKRNDRGVTHTSTNIGNNPSFMNSTLKIFNNKVYLISDSLIIIYDPKSMLIVHTTSTPDHSVYIDHNRVFCFTINDEEHLLNVSRFPLFDPRKVIYFGDIDMIGCGEMRGDYILLECDDNDDELPIFSIKQNKIIKTFKSYVKSYKAKFIDDHTLAILHRDTLTWYNITNGQTITKNTEDDVQDIVVYNQSKVILAYKDYIKIISSNNDKVELIKVDGEIYGICKLFNSDLLILFERDLKIYNLKTGSIVNVIARKESEYVFDTHRAEDRQFILSYKSLIVVERDLGVKEILFEDDMEKIKGVKGNIITLTSNGKREIKLNLENGKVEVSWKIGFSLI
jgi:hypothetical protein